MKILSKAFNLVGPVGNIQALMDYSEALVTAQGKADSQFIAVNCHPHSLHGGTMTNKVVHTVSRAIASQGIPSLRFNFRGVGDSDGEYDEGKGEQADLLAVIGWMNEQYPARQLILSGFSFGSYVSAMAAATIQPALLLTIAPPVKRFDFEGFVKPCSAWSIIMGTADELVDYANVESWVASLSGDMNSFSPNLIAMNGASHFFHGRLVELREHVECCVNTVACSEH